MNNRHLSTLAALAVPALAFAQISTAPTAPATPNSITSSTSAPASTVPKLSPRDQMFIIKAAISGLAEVDDGQLAESKGGPAVQKIGAQMVADHGKANAQLASIAQQENLSPPTAVDAMHAAATARLKTLSGPAFDRAYLHTELLGHVKTIALFKLEASDGHVPALKQFASTTLPTLEQHLAMIRAPAQ